MLYTEPTHKQKTGRCPMSRTLKNRILGIALFASLLVGIGFLASGCYLEVQDEEIFLADLQVDWTIQGSDAASLCSAYGVDYWLVEVDGPESRTVELDCHVHFWSSENDLLALNEGSYTVRVTALDAFRLPVASQWTSTSLYDTGYLNRLSFNFLPSDFGY
jgi:hypothetical protein